MNALVIPITLSQRDKIRFLVRQFGGMEQIDCPLQHFFAPNVYLRQITMPAGAIVVGKIHKTEHLNLIERGKVSIVHDDGSSEVLVAPHVFVSKASVQKVLYIHEETVWRTVHVTDERDLEKLEAALIEADEYPQFDRTQERLAIEAAS